MDRLNRILQADKTPGKVATTDTNPAANPLNKWDGAGLPAARSTPDLMADLLKYQHEHSGTQAQEEKTADLLLNYRKNNPAFQYLTEEVGYTTEPSTPVDDSRKIIDRYRASIELDRVSSNIDMLLQPYRTQMAATDALNLQKQWENHRHELETTPVGNYKRANRQEKPALNLQAPAKQHEYLTLSLGAGSSLITSLFITFPKWPWIAQTGFLSKHIWLMNSLALFSVQMLVFMAGQSILEHQHKKQMAKLEADAMYVKNKSKQALRDTIHHDKATNDNNWLHSSQKPG